MIQIGSGLSKVEVADRPGALTFCNDHFNHLAQPLAFISPGQSRMFEAFQLPISTGAFSQNALRLHECPFGIDRVRRVLPA